MTTELKEQAVEVGPVKMTPTLGKLADALAKAQGEMTHAAKDRENPFFKSKYADLPSVWDSIRGPLSKNGLSVVQLPTEAPAGRVAISTMLMHASGEWIMSAASMRLVKDDPQGAGSGLTYLRRYMLSAVVGVVADEDDDANAATAPGGKRVAHQQQPEKTVTPALAKQLLSWIQEAKADPIRFCDYFGINEIQNLPAIRFEEAEVLLKKRIEMNAHAKGKPAEEEHTPASKAVDAGPHPEQEQTPDRGDAYEGDEPPTRQPIDPATARKIADTLTSLDRTWNDRTRTWAEKVIGRPIGTGEQISHLSADDGKKLLKALLELVQKEATKSSKARA